jgi:hypothetical protein
MKLQVNLRKNLEVLTAYTDLMVVAAMLTSPTKNLRTTQE